MTAATIAPNLLVTVTVEARGTGDEIHIHAGGQGFWVARMVARLGMRSQLCAPLGGESGRVLRGLLDAEGLAVEAVEVEVPNGSYVDDRRGGRRERIAQALAAPLSRHEQDDFYGAALAVGLTARVVVLTGPQPSAAVPASFYRRLAGDLRGNDVFVLADLAGDALTAALAGGVDLLKVSDEELVAAGRAEDAAAGSVRDAVRALHEEGARDVLATRRGEPAVGLIGGDLVELVAPRFGEFDEAGAGDSMTAALAAGQARGMDIADALRLGAAAGSLNVSRRGLGSGRRSDIEKLAREVEVRRL